MVEHVRRRAMLSGAFAEVVVATCDAEIADAVARHGGRVIMTSPAHPAATDRVAEAMERLDCTHVVNVQGDEILVLPDDLRALVAAIQDNPHDLAWNALAPIEESHQLGDHSIVKCVVSTSHRLLVCARDMTSLTRRHETFAPIHMVLGILAYERGFLQRYGLLDRTPVEQAESIDQMRIIEHDVPLQGVLFKKGYPGINEPREVAWVNHYLENDPVQQRVLEGVLNI